MPAVTISRLSQRVQQACAELVSMRKEKERLNAELELIRVENRRARRVLREYGDLLDERKKTKEKLELLLQKLNQLHV